MSVLYPIFRSDLATLLDYVQPDEETDFERLEEGNSAEHHVVHVIRRLRRELEDPKEGVYVVALDPDITGLENIAWAFANEGDADSVIKLLQATEGGEHRAWYTYEPIALSLEDGELQDYLAGRTGLSKEQVARALKAIDEGEDAKLREVLVEVGYVE